MALLPAPDELGAPPKFTAWRHYQDTAIFDAVDATERFVMQVVPTGAGKSLIYLMLAKLLGQRAVVLTRTKALQAQLTADFHSMGLRTVQGMNAYTCMALQPGGELYGVFTELAKKGDVGCDEGPCRVGAGCTLKSGGCGYYDAVRSATEAELVVTNYNYWMHQNAHGKGLGVFGMLILDEAHDAAEALSEFLTVKLEPWQLARINAQPLQGTPTPDEWRQWGAYHYQKASQKAEQLAGEIKLAREEDRPVKRAALDEARFLRGLASTLDTIRGVTEDWVCFWDGGYAAGQGGHGKGSWTFTPAWPAPYAERSLFLGIPRILLTSATVRQKTATYLGIQPATLKVIEYPSTFAKQRRPVLHIETVKVHHKMTDGDTRLWLARIDQLLKARGDRKGIIHTVSYARSRFIYQHSEFRDRMIVHSAEGTRSAIARFKTAAPGAILVSPSVTTGYDFPYQECEYQIVTKVPFPDSRDPVLAARTNTDPQYGMYLAMQSLVQMAGRGMRAPDDQCETLIIDDNVRWFAWKHKALAPQWFLDTLKTVGLIPAPPPRLQSAGGGGGR